MSAENLTAKFTKTPYFNLKKRLLLIAFFLRFFICGAEYSIILPTALIYMKSLSAGYVFMGFVVAAYPVAAMISLPIFGYIYDKTKRLKELLLILNAFELVGNILYALPYSKWIPAIGRFTAGIGDGFIALTVGELAHLYSTSERIGILSLMEIGRVCGLVLGPTVNFFIRKQTFLINGWLLDNKTLPGVIMAFCWLIMQFITVCCVFNLAHEISNFKRLEEEDFEIASATVDKGQQTSTRNIDNSSTASSNKSLREHSESLAYTDSLGDDFFDKEQLEEEEEENEEEENEKKHFLEKQKSVEKTRGKNNQKSSPLLYVLKEIMAFEFFALFWVDVVLWYSQTIFEILLPYITEFEYHWQPMYVGIVYMAGGAELLLMFGFIILTSGKIRDTHLLIASLILTQISLGLLVYESQVTDLTQRLYIFIGICILVFATIPLNLVCTKSILTKIVPQDAQGSVQGMYSSVSRLALIGGPLLGSAIFKRRQLYGVVASGICFFTLISMYASLERIKKREKKVIDG